jgi:hypothetical protein
MKTRLRLVALLGALACGQPAATQYVGVAMSEAAPEKEAKLILTLYARSDTGTSGVMDVGDPVRGTGYSWAWQEGSELQIVSVDAIEGDTVVWTSKQVDEEIGGRYEVVGGAHEGETGTWRATLTRGPSVFAAYEPQVLPMPATSSFWPFLLFLAGGAVIGAWILRAPVPVVAMDAGLHAPVFRTPLGGWLAFFAFAQTVAFFVAAYHAIGSWTSYTGGIGFAAALPGMEALLVTETAFLMLSPILIAIGMVLFWRRSPLTPRFWVGFCVATMVYLLADYSLGAALNSGLHRLIGEELSSQGESAAETRLVVRQVFANLAWGLYWIKSTRVRNTFGATALDTTWTPPTGFVAPSEVAGSAGVTTALADQPSQPTRWKLVGRIAVGLVLVIVVAGIFTWMNRVKEWAVPIGSDIRDVVAGRWSWSHEKPQCGSDAHLIASADSGKLMTISIPDTTSDSGFTLTTYDIERATKSSIRGAIRGETRLTGDGKPVVWDLVLTGPDEYRWRRTDVPGSYTASINRCPAPADSGRT